MGFSVSGATALLLIAFLVSFGAFYSATTGAVDQVQDAQVDQTDRQLTTLNTEFDIASADYNITTENELTIVANNTGATSIQTEDISLLVNGTFVDFGAENVSLANPDETLWVPQQELTLAIGDNDLPSTPTGGETVKLVTDAGVAATATIEVN